MIDKWQRLTRGTGRRWNTIAHLGSYMSNDGWSISFGELRSHADRRPSGVPRDHLLDEIVEDKQKRERENRTT